MKYLSRRIIPYLVLSLVVFAFYIYTIQAQNNDVIVIYEKRFNEQQLIQVNLARNSIEKHVDSQMKEFLSFDSHIEEETSIVNLDEDGLRHTFEDHPIQDVVAVGYIVGDADPILISTENNLPSSTQQMLIDWLNEYQGLDYGSFPEVIITPMIATPEGQWFAMLYPQVSQENDMPYLLGILVDFNQSLQEYIIPVRSGEFGAAWIQDHRGIVIFDHETEIIGQNVSDLHTDYRQLEALDRRYLSEFTGVDEYKFTVERGGEVNRKLVAWTTAQLGDNYYTVALSAPDTEISQDLADASNRNLVWSGILLFLLGLGGYAIFYFQQIDLRRLIQQRTAALETEQKRLEEEIKIRQRIEARLSQSEEIYRLIAQISSDYAFMVRVTDDGEHMIEWITSEAFERATGYKSEDYQLNMRILMQKAIHHDEIDQLRIDMKNLMAGQDVAGEYRLRKKDGEFIWLKVIRTPVWNDEHQRVTHYYGIGQDITHDRKNQELFIENERLKIAYQKEREYTELRRKYLQTLAHEFRTPLTVINTSATLIDRYRDKMTPDKQHREFKKIMSSITYLDQMLTDLGMLARTEKGYLQFKPGRVNIPNLCQEIISSFQETIGAEHNLIFESRLAGISHFQLDDTIIHYILTNLISNAIKYSAPNTEVKLTVEKQNDQLIFEVIDHGTGIPPEEQTQIFEPFYRGQNVDTIRGTGLGLAITKEIVNLHNGTLDLVSEVGRGSTFKVSIPITQD